MAKVGLNFGEKTAITDKSYLVLNDGLVNVKEILGDLSFRSNEGADLIYEDDTTQPRRADGTYPQVRTGEYRGTILGIHSSVQHKTLFINVVGQSSSDVEALNLKYREPVELDGVLITYSSVGGDNKFKLFADSIKRKGQATPQQSQQSQSNKNDKNEKKAN
ncbi:conjugal transfer protein [Streptococcus canis]|uniref:conjugal transfer protein n=1 Tax=Streptococcus canis TaxID=1329 RepID=UPI0029499E28|nr:conjugal transfer protein [Streptococcus canis]MDV5987555.1 conjugal transfer protein [Streptococcus canis]